MRRKSYNAGGFAGHCDWRLPTVAELQTILLDDYPCDFGPCIDETIFGPTVADYHWTPTTYSDDAERAFRVDLYEAFVDDGLKTSGRAVRAVWGGRQRTVRPLRTKASRVSSRLVEAAR